MRPIRALKQGCGVGVEVGVGVGIFYPTSTPHVQFLYILVMLTAQLTRPRASVECFAVIFLREPCRAKSLHFKFVSK